MWRRLWTSDKCRTSLGFELGWCHQGAKDVPLKVFVKHEHAVSLKMGSYSHYNKLFNWVLGQQKVNRIWRKRSSALVSSPTLWKRIWNCNMYLRITEQKNGFENFAGWNYIYVGTENCTFNTSELFLRRAIAGAHITISFSQESSTVAKAQQVSPITENGQSGLNSWQSGWLNLK